MTNTNMQRMEAAAWMGVVFCTSSFAFASTDPDFPITRIHDQMVLKQAGSLYRIRILGFPVYHIAHYVDRHAMASSVLSPEVAKSPVPREIVLRFLRTISPGMMRYGYRHSLEKTNHPDFLKRHKQAVQVFLATVAIPTQEGTEISFLYLPDRGLKVTVSHPGQETPRETWLPYQALGEMVWRMWFANPEKSMARDLVRELF